VKKVKQDWIACALTPEEIAEMESAFKERFQSDIMNNEEVSFEGYYTDHALYLTLILKNFDESFYYPVETVVSITDNKELAMPEARFVLLDFIGTYFEEYFESNRETFLPIAWSPFTVNNNAKISAKGQVLNRKLDKVADELLIAAGYDSDGNPVKKG
jgi:hypothetical protein